MKPQSERQFIVKTLEAYRVDLASRLHVPEVNEMYAAIFIAYPAGKQAGKK